APPPRTFGWLVGLALEVRHLGRLVLGAVLSVCELVLSLALALLLPALAPQRRVTGEVARRLLRAAGQLVENAHFHLRSIDYVVMGPRSRQPGNWVSSVPVAGTTEIEDARP